MMSEHHPSAAAEPQHVAPVVDVEAVREALRNGPRGGLLIASVTLTVLLAGWLAFYFLLFIPRGAIS